MAREVQPDIDLADLEKRLAGLPAGPWRIEVEREVDIGWVVCVKQTGRVVGTEMCICPRRYKPNDVFTFLADSRSIVEALLARVRLAVGILADLADDTTPQSVAFRAGYLKGQMDFQAAALGPHAGPGGPRRVANQGGAACLTERKRMSRESILVEVTAERERQDGMFGGSPHDDTHTASDWGAILIRHLGLAFDDGKPADVCLMNDHCAGHDPERYRRQMVRVAAIAVAALEVFDRKSAEAKSLPVEVPEDAPQSPQDAPGAAAESPTAPVVPVARISGTKLASPHYHYECMAQGVADQYGEVAILLLNSRSELEGHERGIEVILLSQASAAELKAAGERKFHPKNANGKGGGE